MLFKLLHLVELAWQHLTQANQPRNADEAYLAQSSDACDFERRLHALDERDHAGSQGIVFGLYTR